MINSLKDAHRGEQVTLVTGTGRTAFLLIARGYFVILLVDDEDRIIDYYGMDGYTVFATPKQKKQYIGMTLDEVEATLTKKNEIKALKSAREQLDLLREEPVEEPEEVVEEEYDEEYDEGYGEEYDEEYDEE